MKSKEANRSFSAATRVGNQHSCNEDTWGEVGNLFWVIDGASRPSALADKCLTTCDYVKTLSASIFKNYSDTLPLQDILAKSIQNSMSSNCEEVHPSAAIAMVRKINNHAEWLLLGDCFIFYSQDSHVKALTDNRLGTIACDQRTALRNARKVKVSKQRIDDLARDLVLAECSKRNVDGGYWIASDNPSAAYQSITGKLDVKKPIILSTDGVLPSIGDGLLFDTLEHFYQECLSSDADKLVHKAGKYLQDSPVITKVDDITVMKIQ